VDPSRLGERLQEARATIGLSQSEVAQALGLPRPAISLIEAGKRSVDSKELVHFARLYGVAVSRLLGESEPDDLISHFRAQTHLSTEETDLVGMMIEWARNYAELEHAAFGEQRYDLPVYPVPRGRVTEQGSYLAQQERRRLGIGPTAALPSVLGLLESEGVKVKVDRFGQDMNHVSGFYLFSPEFGPCVAINAEHSTSRQRFTAAHEYEHFLVDRDEQDAGVCQWTRRRELREMRANAFAAAFLLPDEGVEEFLSDLGAEVGRVNPEQILRLAFHFGASFQAVLWRLVNLQWLSRQQREELAKTSPAAVAPLLGLEGAPSDRTETKPERLNLIAIEAWRAGAIEQEELAETLNMSASDFKDELLGPRYSQTRHRAPSPAEPEWL
jgi:Zn-dependent peptidase ImmA (M78 family)/DNA-binding XRE family transcriptional regulator